MNMRDLAAAAEANGWSEAAADRDSFGDFRSASWRNSAKDTILHAEAFRERERAGVVSSVKASTTDPLGWAASLIESWSEQEGNLNDAVTFLNRN